MMNATPIYGERAYLIDKTIVLADLHIGIEEEYRKSGIFLTSQTSIFVERIRKLCKKYNAKELIILGDLKHGIGKIERREWKEIPLFIENVEKFVKLKLVKGNHDGSIEKIVGKEIVSNYIICDKICLMHGHMRPDEEAFKCEKMIFGHIHPVIKLVDSLGGKRYEHCWIRGEPRKLEKYKNFRVKEIVVMPAFNELCGKPISCKGKTMIEKIAKIQDSKIYLLNGTYLGLFKELVHV
ncbi:MAG: metallophosphoesterase [Candidatus Thermoplasmatota archaeon]